MKSVSRKSYPTALRTTPPSCPSETSFAVCVFSSFLDKSFRTHRSEHRQRRAVSKHMHHESMTNYTRRCTNKQQSWFGEVFGLCVGGGLGAQRDQRPSWMHFRMRKPHSWLTLRGCFLVQFALFVLLFFDIDCIQNGISYRFVVLFSTHVRIHLVSFLEQGGNSVFLKFFYGKP